MSHVLVHAHIYKLFYTHIHKFIKLRQKNNSISQSQKVLQSSHTLKIPSLTRQPFVKGAFQQTYFDN